MTNPAPSYDITHSPVLEALRAENAELVKALEHARTQMQHPDELIDLALAKAKGRAALAAVGEGEA